MSLIKKRGLNFSKEEELMLVEEVEKEQGVIECKTTNKLSTCEKEQAWARIELNFNSKSTHCRSIDQLKAKYDNLKTKAKKAVARNRINLTVTGGGPASSTDFDPVVEAVLRIVNIKTIGDISVEYVEIPPTPATEASEVPVSCQTMESCVSELCALRNDVTESMNPITVQSIVDTPQVKKRRSSWNQYVPSKLKDPVSKKLRLTIPNPLVDTKIIYYEAKTLYLTIRGEIDAQQQRAEREKNKEEREKKEEERRNEEFKMRIRLLELEIAQKQKDLTK
ncbi:uncharacterized protein [Onthophagus taurus]|uniref:uncharacterized protein isoform X2 n=1 Tax=Onthophagus taurus TaxID=166361 RepID=UPI0039BDA425